MNHKLSGGGGLVHSDEALGQAAKASGRPTRWGILTFCAWLNYGSLLQAFALQETVRGMGYDVVMVDRWFERDNFSLRGPFTRPTPRWAVLYALRFVLCCGFFGEIVRRLRTIAFRKRYLRMTDYHFVEWQEVATRDLGLNALIVGSDQVWSCKSVGDPEPFLLVDAPKSLRAISYAASFGVWKMPEWRAELFRKQLPRFSAISVREREGVDIARSVGAEATQTLDPTLLLTEETWRETFGLESVGKQRPTRMTLVAYLMDKETPERQGVLAAFARRNDCAVHLFHPTAASLMPRSLRALQAHFRMVGQRFFSPLKVRLSAGPKEFVETLAGATYVVANSFHALMFATIFRKNVRILLPKADDEHGQQGQVRFRWFAERYVKGPLFVRSVEEALESFERGEAVTFDEGALAADRERSLAWLRGALGRALTEI